MYFVESNRSIHPSFSIKTQIYVIAPKVSETDPMNSSEKPIPPNIAKWLLPLTAEEQSLLEMFDRVKALEREAKISASKAAQAKIMGTRDPMSSKLSNEEVTITEAERDQQSRKLTVSPVDVDDKQSVHDGVHDDYRSDEDATSKSLIRKEEQSDPDVAKQQDKILRRQTAKLETLRSENDAALKKNDEERVAAKAEEDMRQELLKTVEHDLIDSVMMGPILKKKQPRNWDEFEAAEESLDETMEAEADYVQTTMTRKKGRMDETLETTNSHQNRSMNSFLRDFSKTLGKSQASGTSCETFYITVLFTISYAHEF